MTDRSYTGTTTIDLLINSLFRLMSWLLFTKPQQQCQICSQKDTNGDLQGSGDFDCKNSEAEPLMETKYPAWQNFCTLRYIVMGKMAGFSQESPTAHVFSPLTLRVCRHGKTESRSRYQQPCHDTVQCV